jgi:flavin reductase (DIM6/NTAB) family NADH-FMN oxidoreductase RutF/rubredoxin
MDKGALQKCSYGVYVVSTQSEGKLNGQIANTACQITSEPVTVSVSLNKDNLTHDLIVKSNVFTISVLSEDVPMQFIGRFGFKSGRHTDKFDGINYKTGLTGAPIVLDYVTSYAECEVIGSMDVGTHTVFVGRVLDAEVVSDREPMTYAYYHQVKGGKSPKTAPTYVARGNEGENKSEKEEQKSMEKYTCTVCGYVYDPAEGDSSAGIAPGTAFEDLPESWVCPVCGAPKSEFEKA